MREKKKNNVLWIVLACVFFVLAAVICVCFLVPGDALPRAQEESASAQVEIPVPSLVPPSAEPHAADTNADASAEAGTDSAAEEEAGGAPYESPVDFEGLWAVNSDVCAWLYIPGADLSLPVMQHPTDNAYYLTHDIQGNSSSSGALFIEDYNHSDFTDMCTIVYGHRMYSGEMFGTLQSVYSDQATFKASQTIMMYLPEREIEYQVFAAVPYDNTHILYYHDFDDQLSYRKFINSIYSTTGIGATLEEELKPKYGEKLLILSTCLWGDKDNRYLVLAKERSE